MSSCASPISNGCSEGGRGIGGVTVKGKTIGLCMIAKDESGVILRCLESVRPVVDYILVEDTGSSDGTGTIVREWLRRTGLPGQVIAEPWRDFAYNRSHALAMLRQVQEVDYALVLDADDRLVFDAGFDAAAFKAGLSRDWYGVEIRRGPARYWRNQICSNRLSFRYRGVLHEFLDEPRPGASPGTATGFHIVSGQDGARSHDPNRYRKDAEILERALETETEPSLRARYTFYLAQSYRDAGDRESALRNYLKRASLDDRRDEVFESLYNSAQLLTAMSRPFDEVLAMYLRAADAAPGRAEALHGASRLCREHDKFEDGYAYARRGLSVPYPGDGPFVETWIYEYGLLDELSVNSYWIGRYRESLEACRRLLREGKLPPEMRDRVRKNARFAAEQVQREDGQRAVATPRALRSRVKDSPRVLIAILAKQKEPSLPLYLECIEALDYPKSAIVLYIRTNNNTDRTEEILRNWATRVRPLYAAVEFNATDIDMRVEQFREHEWNATRFKALGHIRDASLRRALDHDCDFYFVVDADNFVRPMTLRELVALDLPIVAPLLRLTVAQDPYSNYHAAIDANGYYQECDQYYWVLRRQIRGIIEMPVVHCTYLVRADVIPELSYVDESERHEYVVFSDSARQADIPQYLDNRQVYGYITFGESDQHYVSDGIERARSLLRNDRAESDLGGA